MRIILLGPPGAGKGTQSKSLAKRLELAHISTGDLLRGNVSAGTELGKQAKAYMEKGALVPDELVTGMLRERFNQDDIKNGFILDGYPRTIKQAESLDRLLEEKAIKIDKVFYLDTGEKVIIQRLSGRLVCSKCQANFHKTNMPPKKEMVCDYCGGSLYQRSDDKEETIRKRLEVYRQESAPLIKYYESKGKLESVLADGEASIVLDEIVRLVKNQE
ncbi:MAG: adenylate kinase [Candidatus Omnitrophica bacterium]|jgi:adenylate kinase|nr:adenylate kinase [Candidatus Omnitrophota bacterium]